MLNKQFLQDVEHFVRNQTAYSELIEACFLNKRLMSGCCVLILCKAKTHGAHRCFHLSSGLQHFGQNGKHIFPSHSLQI